MLSNDVFSDDYEEFEMPVITEADTWAALAPGGKYASPTMSSWLRAALQPIMNGNDIVFYEGKDKETIVFPPVTDGNPTSDNLPCLSDALIRAAPLLTQGKKMIFPLAEEHGVFFGWGPLRMHWVTLHYDPTTQIATLIDSRPTLNSWTYSTEPMKQLLNAGLEVLGLGLGVETFNHLYLATQHDNIFCGAWTATTIEALANGGMSIEDHTRTISSEDKDGIIEHHRRMILDNKNKGIYRRRNTCTEMNMKKSNSRDSITTANTSQESLSSLDSNDMMSWVMESDPISPMFTPSVHQAQIEQFTSNENEAVRIAAAKFQSSLQTPGALLDMLISREGLSLNDSKLTYQSCGQQNVEGLLTAVESVYQGMSIAEMKQSSRKNVGYSLFDPGRLRNLLKMIGFSEDAIRAMSLRAVLKYDAAIWVQLNHAIESSSLCKYQAMLSNPELVSFSFDNFGSPTREELSKNDRMLMETSAVNTHFNRLLYTAFAEVIKADLILAKKTAPSKDLAGCTMPFRLANPRSELCFMRSNAEGRVLTTFNPFGMRAGGLSNEVISRLITEEYLKGGRLVVPPVCPTGQIDSVRAFNDQQVSEVFLEDLPQPDHQDNQPGANQVPNGEPIWDWAFAWQCMSSPTALNTYGTVLVLAGLIIAGAVATSAIPVVLGATVAVSGFALGAACFFNARSNHPVADAVTNGARADWF